MSIFGTFDWPNTRTSNFHEVCMPATQYTFMFANMRRNTTVKKVEEYRKKLLFSIKLRAFHDKEKISRSRYAVCESLRI